MLLLELCCTASLQASRLGQLDAANSLQSTRWHQRLAKNVCRCRGSSIRTFTLHYSFIACRKAGRNFTVSPFKRSASLSPSNWLVSSDGRGLASYSSIESFAGLHFQIWRKHTSSTKSGHHLYSVISSQQSDIPELSQVSTLETLWTLVSESRESLVAAASVLWCFNALFSAFMFSTD